MFLSNFESGVDAKKRVSIPAPFRRVLGGADSVYLWPSLDKPCIEGAGEGLMQQFEDSMADFAVAYADQAERDHEALVAAVRAGRIEIQSEA